MTIPIIDRSDRYSEIARAVEAARADLVSFLQRLVQIPSLPNQEGDAQEMIARKLVSLGMDVDIIPTRFDEIQGHPAFGDDGFSRDTRVNVVGRWKGSLPTRAKSLLLNGHIDVVPPGDAALWADSPWSGVIRDGNLFGRGSCDMKAGLCAGIFAIDILQRLGFAPSGDVLFESVIGEESGGVGTLTTILKGIRADAVILLEPTRMEIAPLQSGALTFRLKVSGRSIHAAMKPYGVSAIEKFGILLQAINNLEASRMVGFSNPLYLDPKNIAPISIGTVRGGEWHSTVPESLVAEGRMGVFPGETNEAARAAMQAAIHSAAAADPWLAQHPPVIEWFEGQFESAATPLDDPIIKSLGASHRAVTGREAVMRAVTYGSDMRLFRNHAGMPATHYGPGDVSVAHAANEFVPIDELISVTRVIAGLITDWCSD